MNSAFELAVFNSLDDASVVSCQEYLALDAVGSRSWKPDFNNSALIIKEQGEVRLSDEWNFGDFCLILRQLHDVARRLKQSELGILRSAVLDQASPPYLLFIPDAGGRADTVSISMVFIRDARIGNCFPVDTGLRGEVRRLFSYVRKSKNRLLADDHFAGEGLTVPKSIIFDRLALLDTLNEQIELGERVASQQA